VSEECLAHAGERFKPLLLAVLQIVITSIADFSEIDGDFLVLLSFLLSYRAGAPEGDVVAQAMFVIQRNMRMVSEYR